MVDIRQPYAALDITDIRVSRGLEPDEVLSNQMHVEGVAKLRKGLTHHLTYCRVDTDDPSKVQEVINDSQKHR